MTTPDPELKQIYAEHRAVNDVMMAFTNVRRLKCVSCGAKASTNERQGMAAAREMYEKGWSATVPIGKPAEAICPDCGIL